MRAAIVTTGVLNLDSSVARAMEINLEPLYARYPSGGAVEPSPSERCTITESVQCPNL